jgi:two-component system, NtrC family, sensor histidine kinase HydH
VVSGTGLGKFFGRAGWLITTLALAIVLVVTAWANYRGAIAAADTVTRGQADLLHVKLDPLLAQATNEQAGEKLSAFLAEHTKGGLRYIGLLNPDGSLSGSAGKAAAPVEMPPMGMLMAPGGGQYSVTIGEVVRVYHVRPRPRTAGDRPFGPPPGARRGPGRDGFPGQPPEPGRPRYLHYSVMEFEPIIANGLEARAERSFLLTCVGAIILTLAALLFWRTSQQYDRARVRLEEQKRLSVLGEMSAVLAHEIRNPLASLKGNAQLLAERMAPETRERTRADRVIVEATRLEALTSDLLDFARSGPIELKAADPAEVLRTSIEDVSENGFEIDTSAAPRQWTIDANRVRHALVNVLQNAQQASAGQRPPAVRVSEEQGRLIYEIRDFGAGLPADAGERIFDPFFTTRTNGTGLGLAVVRRVAELHGGTVTARNHVDGGAVFRIELPRNPS